MPESTIGERLIALKEQSGLSLAKIAAAAGYQGASSIQKLFRAEYGPTRLSRSVAERLAAALANHGAPPILASEIHALALNVGQDEEADTRRFIQDAESSSHTIFVYITGISLRKIRSSDDYIIPSFTIDLYNTPDMISAPAHLRFKGIAGFQVITGNMWPKYDIGETIWYSEIDQARIGDVIVIGVKADHDNQKEAYVLGRMMDLNDDELKFSQLKPDRINVLPRSRIQSLRRILTYADLLPVSINAGGPDYPID